MNSLVMYTPEQVAELLQLNKNTVYKLIKRGEINAKKYGGVYRIPAQALSFVFTGMDKDLLMASREDEQNLEGVMREIKNVRRDLWGVK